MILNDLSPMPFGMYKGKPMQDIPASYLHYLWINNLKNHSPGSNQEAVYNYIKENVHALKKENSDLIWS